MIDYEEDWLIPLVFRLKGSVTCRALLFAVPSSLLALLLVSIDEFAPSFRESVGLLEMAKSQFWSATTAVLGIMLGFRTNRAMSRFWEGTGLLHQMRGEWFDSVSCCVTFSRSAVDQKPIEVNNFRHTLVRLMSLCHGSALEEIAGDKSDGIETIDSYGLNDATLKHLRDCKENLKFNRVEVLLHLMQSLIIKAHEDGVVKVPPPILSRVFQTLSRGFVNLLNAKKIADTRFPFPFAQILTMLLLIQVVLTPIMLSCLTTSKVWATVFTFVPIFAMFYLDFVGVELENPFGSDDNDLPLEHFQSEMNNCLLMLLHDKADLVPDVSEERCVMDFEILQESLAFSDGTDQVEHTPSKDYTRLKSRARISCFKYDQVEDRISAFGTGQYDGEGNKSNKLLHSTSNLQAMASEAPAQTKVVVQDKVQTEEFSFHVSAGRRAASDVEPARAFGDTEAAAQDLQARQGSRGFPGDAEKAGELLAALPCTDTSASHSQAGTQGFDAALFRCSVQAYDEPPHPMVQVCVPHRARSSRSQRAVAAANNRPSREIRRPFPEICLCPKTHEDLTGSTENPSMS